MAQSMGNKTLVFRALWQTRVPRYGGPLTILPLSYPKNYLSPLPILKYLRETLGLPLNVTFNNPSLTEYLQPIAAT